MSQRLRRDYSHVTSQESTRSYARKSIHHRAENKEIIEEEETFDEEEEENNLNNCERDTLYPNLDEELRKVCKPNVSGKNSKEPKHSVISQISDSSMNSSPYFQKIIFLLLFVVVAIGGFFMYNSSKKLTAEINVREIVTDMQYHFKEQQPHTFKVLDRALNKVVMDKPEPRAPAIFTLVANKGAEKTASDFSLHLANALAPGEYLSINESVQWHNDPENLKLKIDEEIKSTLKNEILNVVIVDRLNAIPIDAAMIFHGFCDHEFAPYKQAVYIFIVHLNRSIPQNPTIKDIDAAALESLRNIWYTATDDVVESLLTRLTVNVVNII